MRNRHNDHTRHSDQRQDQQQPPATTTDAGIPAPTDEYSLTVGPTDREHLVSNVVTHLSQGVPRTIQERAVRDYWSKVDTDLGARIGRGVGIEAPQLTGARA